MKDSFWMSFVLLSFVLMNPLALADEGRNMMGWMGPNCPMCGAMGGFGMVVWAILVLAAIGALISLAVFLIRRSRHKS